VGSETGLKAIVPIPGGSAGAGNNFILPPGGVECTGGISMVIAQLFNTTSTGTNHAAGDVSGTVYYRT
jgi:hypothetical protein